MKPLRILALAKQIPVFEDMRLGADRRLVRDSQIQHMNDYCRRAVSKGKELAGLTRGSLGVMTMGPPSAETVCREALAFGADYGIHICDEAFAGSDTLATARALAKSIELTGPYDLILCGLNSLDADTGQVPPQVAQLLNLPFAAGVKGLELKDIPAGCELRLDLEQDDERSMVEVALPALLSCAERLCDPCKIKDPEVWSQMDGSLIRRLAASDLGEGPWGLAGSPTFVGETKILQVEREQIVLECSEEAVRLAAKRCAERENIVGGSVEPAAPAPEPVTHKPNTHTPEPATHTPEPATHTTATAEPAAPTTATAEPAAPTTVPPPNFTSDQFCIAVLVEPDRPRLTRELLGTAALLARQTSGQVVALGTHLPTPLELASFGAASAVEFKSAATLIPEEDSAMAFSNWLKQHRQVWAVLAPGTFWGRHVASRMAVLQEAGLVGDAISLTVQHPEPAKAPLLIADKPAFGGQMVAEIGCASPLQMVTVRSGVLALLDPCTSTPAVVSQQTCQSGSKVRILSRTRADDSSELANAELVIGVGQGVDPQKYPLLDELSQKLGATLCATRKVTDQGWMPRARQVGITGHTISPSLFISVGSSGKFNHMVGVRTAGTIVAINCDPQAAVFGVADVGLVGDWEQALPLLVEALGEAGFGASQ